MQTLNNRMNAWKLIFSIGGLGEESERSDEIINPTLFHDCENKLCQLLIQLHTMETFLPSFILQVSTSKDGAKLPNIGPYCLCLRTLLFGANDNRSDDVTVPPFTVFRSVLLSPNKLKQLKYKPNLTL